MTSGVRVPTVTVTVFNPAVLPSVHVPIGVAAPATVDVGAVERVPPPPVTATVMPTPPRILPLASFTENVGVAVRARPAVADGVVLATSTDDGVGGAVPSLHAVPNVARAIIGKMR
jgi:hypothetical protein